MKSTPPPFHHCDNLVGFFQIENSKNNYIIVLDTEKDGSSSRLTLFLLEKDGPRQIKTIDSSDAGIHAIDAVRDDKGVLFCIELNRFNALKWTRADATTFFDPSFSALFAPVIEGDIPEKYIEKINLSPAEHWNTLMLAPQKWLFDPSFVRGNKAGDQTLANTSDGQLVLLEKELNGKIGLTHVVANGIHPRACRTQTGIVYTFLRDADPVSPFWRRNQMPKTASLLVRENGNLVNLSKTLGLTKVLNHDLSLDANGIPWIFALQDAPIGTILAAIIKKSTDEWFVVGKKRLAEDTWRISVSSADQAWRITTASKDGAKWQLHYLLWKIPSAPASTNLP